MAGLERVERVLKDIRDRKKTYGGGRSDDDDRILTMKRRIEDLERKVEDYNERFYDLERRFEGQQEALTIMAAILEQKNVQDGESEEVQVIKVQKRPVFDRFRNRDFRHNNQGLTPVNDESHYSNQEEQIESDDDEWGKEQKERRDRERNVVVKGITKTGWHARTEVEAGIKAVCRGTVEIEDVWTTAETLDGSMLVVKLISKDHKAKMKAQTKGFQELGWTIFDDQTFIERRTRNALLTKRRKLQSNGEEYHIEGNQLIGSTQIWTWQEMEGKFEVENIRESVNNARNNRISWDRESERSLSGDYKRRKMY